MRTNTLIALSFPPLALFVIMAFAIDFEYANQYGLSADQLIDTSRGINPFNPGANPALTESARESRANWGKTSAIENAKPIEVSESNNLDTSQTGLSQDDATPSATSAVGNWSFSLKDSENRFMTLTLSQSGNTLFGVGTMNENNSTQMISASGLLVGDKLDLNVTSFATANLYSFSLVKKENTASGEFKAFTSGGASWIGNVDGILMPNVNAKTAPIETVSTKINDVSSTTASSGTNYTTSSEAIPEKKAGTYTFEGELAKFGKKQIRDMA